MILNDGSVLFSWPLDQHIITAGWYYSSGVLHRALDFRASVVPVRAAGDATVNWVQEWDGKSLSGNQSYGNAIKLEHAKYNQETLETLYGHLSSILVKKGQKVKEGDVIGYTGNTGNSFGSHLHFEVRLNGTRVNPLNWLDNDFTTANDDVNLGEYTSVTRPAKEENTVASFTSDTLKIGPVSTGDRNTMKQFADKLVVQYQDSGDYLIVGPMSNGDRDSVAEKAQSLGLGCVDYFEREADPGTELVDLGDITDSLARLEEGVAALKDSEKQILDGLSKITSMLSAAGKALQ